MAAALKLTMSGNIVHGAYSDITQFPYSAFVAIAICSCGSSILNQDILITAAHCVYDYPDPENMVAFVGHRKRQKGSQHLIRNLIIHERYDFKRTKNDIALLKLKTSLNFGSNVAKVILMPNPPYETAIVAGWGKTNENGRFISDYLKYMTQDVYKRKDCGVIGLENIPEGTICGENRRKDGHPEVGDSGSALVVRNYIQIGIVSFNLPDISDTNTVFTDIGYFYKWIQKNSKDLYCFSKTARNKKIKKIMMKYKQNGIN